MLTHQQALTNLSVLYRKVKMVPEEHEAIQESIAVLTNLVSPTTSDRKLNITSQEAFSNMVAVYSRAALTADEFEAMKETLSILAKIVKESDTSAQNAAKNDKK